jgi:hypothetical protein
VPDAVAPVGGTPEGLTLAAAVPPPIQAFTALDMASVLAMSESRERQVAPVMWVESLRCMRGPWGGPLSSDREEAETSPRMRRDSVGVAIYYGLSEPLVNAAKLAHTSIASVELARRTPPQRS